MMRKFVAVLLVLIMALSVTVPAMCAEECDAPAALEQVATEEQPTEIPDDPTEQADVTEPDEPVAIMAPDKPEYAETAANAYPVISKIEAVKDGVKISWKAFSGAKKYRVFRKNGDGWQKLGDATATSYSYTKAAVGETNTYTIRAIGADGKYLGAYDPNGFTFTKFAAAKITDIAAVTYRDGRFAICIRFNPAEGAHFYTAFVRLNGGKWQDCGEINDEYDDTIYYFPETNISGVRLTFTVRSMIGSRTWTSYYDTVGKDFTYIAKPVLSVSNTASGQKLSVTVPNGAAKVRLFIHNGSGWKKLADTTATYVNKSVSGGKEYTYTARALDKNGKYVSDYDKQGKTSVYYAQPKITSLTNDESGVLLKWGKVAGVAENNCYYRVFYKMGSDKSWRKLGDTAYPAMTATGVSNNTKITFTVRVVTSRGTYVSSYDTAGKSIVAFDTPRISIVNNSASGATIKWNKVAGVAKYRVFIQSAAGWTKIGDTASNSFLYTKPTVGGTYVYMVRGMDKNGKFCTGYESGLAVPFYKNNPRQFSAKKIVANVRAYAKSLGLTEDEDLVAYDGDDSTYDLALDNSGKYGTNTGDLTTLFSDWANITLEMLATQVVDGYKLPRADGIYRIYYEQEGNGYTVHLLFTIAEE